MRVNELIGILQTMPEEAEVFHLWDGEARTEIIKVWFSHSGCVITADDEEECYSLDTCPDYVTEAYFEKHIWGWNSREHKNIDKEEE